MDARRVHDRVHGEIALPPLLAALSTTPFFWRLDAVRQLGGCAFVYPSATHTRREHSLGVCHLAGQMGEHLARQRPDLVDADDVLCLQLAGLVHDLGHGPFSHLFEEYVRAAPDGDAHWSHEAMGLRVLDALLARHPELDVPSHFAARTEAAARRHLAFVRLLVVGLPRDAPWPGAAVGRPEAKRFLVDVVHNRATGLDVDKLDYLARDALAVFGATKPLQWERLVRGARVVERDGRYELGFDEAVALDVAEVFALRARLHHRVYQHRAVVVVEAMLGRLMRALDACLPVGERLVDAARDPLAFAALTDASVLQRAYEADARLAGAREAHRALYRRPWLARVPVTAWLHTRPGCAACGARTDVADAHCVHCGASTVDRPALSVARDDGGAAAGTVLVTPECALSDEEATCEMRAVLGREDVRVHVLDVHCGAAGALVDPHGRAWRDFDPLRRVVFCARDGRAVRMRPCGFHVPEVRHVRAAHCYLPADATAAEVERARAAFVAWATTIGEVAEDAA